jgi:[ribosomal protein S18]-alanine N-acetyltransferase
VRDLRWTDLEAVARLESEVFPRDGWTLATWWSELAGRPRRAYVVHEGADRVVDAYAGVDLGGDVADVMTMAVAPWARGMGLGRLLLDELVARAEADHAQHLMLEVRADNTPAQKLYTARGFEVLAVRRRYYQPGDVDAHVMRLALADAA